MASPEPWPSCALSAARYSGPPRQALVTLTGACLRPTPAPVTVMTASPRPPAPQPAYLHSSAYFRLFPPERLRPIRQHLSAGAVSSRYGRAPALPRFRYLPRNRSGTEPERAALPFCPGFLPRPRQLERTRPCRRPRERPRAGAPRSAGRISGKPERQCGAGSHARKPWAKPV
jgi:hypothetical protein